MIEAGPADFADVEEAVDAADVDERAVVLERLDGSLALLADFEDVPQAGGGFGAFLFEEGASADDEVAFLSVGFDDLDA